VQDNGHLQKGMRTGFCGALTTFSGWNHQMAEMVLEGTSGSVARAVWGWGDFSPSITSLAYMRTGVHVIFVSWGVTMRLFGTRSPFPRTLIPLTRVAPPR